MFNMEVIMLFVLLNMFIGLGWSSQVSRDVNVEGSKADCIAADVDRLCKYTCSLFGVNSKCILKDQKLSCKCSYFIGSNNSMVDGIWGSWKDNGTCSKTCGGGTKTQIRQCNNSLRANGGSSCRGSSTQTLQCSTQLCPVFSKVLVALGYNSIEIADVEIIDLLLSNTTCKKPQNFQYANYVPSGGLGFQDKPLICGGEYNRSSCHLYVDGTWKSSESLKEGRLRFAMTKSPFQDGSKLFLTGGEDQSNQNLNSSEVLTENFGWQVSVPLPVKIYAHCMVTFNSTAVMVIGGFQNGQTSGKSFLFNSERNIWTEGPKLNTSRAYHSCGSIRRNIQTEDKSLIAVGGSVAYYLRSVEVLDLDSNAWRTGPDLKFGIHGAAMVEDPSGGVVLIGGYGDYGNLDTLYWLPHAGSDATWKLMPQKLKTGRHVHTAFLIPDDIAACN